MGPMLLLLVAWSVSLVAVARIVVIRAQHTRPGELGRPYGHIELGLLGRRRRRAIAASLGALRAAGAIDAYSWGALHAVAPPPDAATAVDLAVYAAAERNASVVSVVNDEAVAAALTAVEEELRAAGALLRRPSARFYSRVRWPTLGAILLGCLAAPVAFGFPVLGGLALFLSAAWYLLIAAGIIEYNAGRTRLGRRILRQAKASDLPTAIALAGVEVLLAADKSFAERARLLRWHPEREEED